VLIAASIPVAALLILTLMTIYAKDSALQRGRAVV